MRQVPSLLVGAGLATGMLLGVGRARATPADEARDYGAVGPYAVRPSSIPTRVPGQDRFDAYCPEARERRPVIVVARPGRFVHADPQSVDPTWLATHLASWGFVVLVEADSSFGQPVERFFEEHRRDRPGDACSPGLAVGWVGLGRQANRAESRAREFAGASVGVRASALVAIDPVILPRSTPKQEDGQGVRTVHVLALASKGWKYDLSAITPERPGRVTFARVPLASHCDVVAPTDDACRALPGGAEAQPAATAFVLDYTTAWLLAYVAGDEQALSAIPPRRTEGLSDVRTSPFPSYPLFDRDWLSGSITLGDTLGLAGQPSAATVGLRLPVFFLWHDRRDKERTPNGVGPYAELLVAGKDPVFGGGVEARVRLPKQLWWAPSAGAYARDYDRLEPGLTAGSFVGFALDHGETFVPFGVRVDGRYGLGPSHERAVFVGVEVHWIAPLLPLVGLGVLGKLVPIGID